ncbi:hypothetical protein [Sphingomonas sp. Leaf10]|uniref:hypothetical protein n=1 Tax=Sphingomonas sp. Leaf10 TaxID=1735676 RepID=UPI000A8CDBC4|nr:hypothetical protein [Sphingomonas sp. Leaf10]
MKLPIGAIARFALKRIVLPAIGKAIASNANPLTKEAAERALREAVQDEVLRRVG